MGRGSASLCLAVRLRITLFKDCVYACVFVCVASTQECMYACMYVYVYVYVYVHASGCVRERLRE